MRLMRSMERSMGLDAEAWARHASPASVYTRYSVLPLFILAVWSRSWIGLWALLPLALVVVWARVNPHLFAAPASTRSWASRAVMGERVWLNRAAVPIPEAEHQWAIGLSVLNGLGILPLAWGLWVLDPGWTVAGMVQIMIAKSWFLDRMARLFDRMADHPAYEGWLH